MKLLILSDTAAPHTRRWARWFANRGHEVHVVSLNPNGLPGYAPASVHSVWRPRFGNSLPERIAKIPVVLSRVRRLIDRIGPDVVHAHSAGGYSWVAMLTGVRPYVVTPWGTDLLVDIEKSRVNRWLTERALRKAELVTTDGFHFVKILHDLGVDENKILVHSFGTDVNHFSPGTAADERDALGIGEGPLVISTRTPTPVHDVKTFIEAIPEISKSHPNAHFAIVGDGSERRRLQGLADELRVSDRTRFVGMVEEDRMCRLLRASDVYVSTSTMDAGLAGSTAEAMAIELPIVQTDNSDNAYWTPHGRGGFLFPNSDHDSLASAVCRLLDDAQLRRQMGEANRRKILSEYNMDEEMSRIESEYVRMAKGAGKLA